MQQIVERYIEAFNLTDPASRSELLEEIYTADCTYTDPHVDLQGPAAVGEFIGQTQERFPAMTFRLRGPIDAHHDQARFQWQAGPEDAPEQFVGFDVLILSDGRIRSVYGFTDAAPGA